MFWLTVALVGPLASLAAAQAPVPTEDCPLLGPGFPSDFDLAKDNFIKHAASAFPSQIDKLFEGSGLNRSDISFAIDVFSSSTNSTIYSYFHSGEKLAPFLSAGVLDDGTIFRIGSVSKLYTVYALLAAGGIEVFAHPVTKYLPELVCHGKRPDKIHWDQVTVGALASHQGGSGGFPFKFVECELQKNCDIKAFLAEMRDTKRAVVPAFQASLYSDAGFGVLGRVLEKLTNKTYAEALQTSLAGPLGLKSSSSIKPSDKGLNALATNDSSWGFDNQLTAPSGGVYSNAHDLRELGLSILQARLLSADTARHWMKPVAHTAALTSSVGAPWEIHRLTLPVSPASKRTRLSDLYTKLGGQLGYATVFALSPDHGLGFSINIAGDAAIAARIPLRDLVGSVFVTAAEYAGVENAAINYSGKFADPNNKDSSVSLKIDSDRPGVGLESLFINGTDWLGNITLSQGELDSSKFSYRLFPAELEYPNPSSSGVIKKFNAASSSIAGEPRAAIEGGPGLFDDCSSWMSTGFFTTGEFELEVVKGRVESVKYLDANVTMQRVK